jgi:hypothetical protein
VGFVGWGFLFEWRSGFLSGFLKENNCAYFFQERKCKTRGINVWSYSAELDYYETIWLIIVRK